VATSSASIPLVELVVEGTDPVRQRGQRRLGGRGSRIGETSGAEPHPLGDEGGHREPLKRATELLRCAVAEVAVGTIDTGAPIYLTVPMSCT
jgi:hypothetical protein